MCEKGGSKMTEVTNKNETKTEGRQGAMCVQSHDQKMLSHLDKNMSWPIKNKDGDFGFIFSESYLKKDLYK